MAEPTPSRYDRAQLERIIRRAAELQTGEHEIADELSGEEVLKLGRDVGIPARYLEQAMIEERVRTPDAALSGMLDRVAGPALVRAMRVVRGTPDQVQHHLMTWIEENELLTVAREQPGRLLWEPMGGFHSAMRRASAAVGGLPRPYMLVRAKRVTGTIAQLETGYCHITLEADLAGSRSATIGGAAALVATGAAAAAVLTILHAFMPLALLPIPFGLAGGWGVLRTFRPVVERTQLGLERALDEIERSGDRPAGQLPPPRAGLLESVLGEVRKAWK